MRKVNFGHQIEFIFCSYVKIRVVLICTPKLKKISDFLFTSLISVYHLHEFKLLFLFVFQVILAET